jgi:hypothetical protein
MPDFGLDACLSRMLRPRTAGLARTIHQANIVKGGVPLLASGTDEI